MEEEFLTMKLKELFPQINEIDISRPIGHVLAESKELKSHKSKIELGYKLFLCCCLISVKEKMPMAGPSGVIDDMWHAHILDSELYHRHCEKIFGSYLHHNPNKVSDQVSNELPDELPYDVNSCALYETVKILSKNHGWLKKSLPLIAFLSQKNIHRLK